MHWTQRPWLRSLLCLFILAAVMKGLQAQWSRFGRKIEVQAPFETPAKTTDRLVVAHFMLGNTKPFTDQDWLATFSLAIDTGLDALALNLGPETWQKHQASVAYDLLSASPMSDKLKLFISLDMMVLPSANVHDADELVDMLRPWLNSSAQLIWRGGALLSTFGGQDAAFGGQGWDAVLSVLRKRMKINFFPAFFLPPEQYLAIDQVDGVFAWNGGWPLGDAPMSLVEDEAFLRHDKPYMAAVSPSFFTHYGSIGEWAFNKNWIYRSDDLLYPTRWSQLINATAQGQGPEMIQVISWNDFGESHNIGPVLGAQPGSEAWTNDMPHDAFRQLTKEFASRWKSGAGWDAEDYTIFMWYRPHPANLVVEGDQVGRPAHADRASDLINFVVLAPSSSTELSLRVTTGGETSKIDIVGGRLNAITTPFKAGSVAFTLLQRREALLRGEGRPITSVPAGYNFNFWSGVWRSASNDGYTLQGKKENLHPSA